MTKEKLREKLRAGKTLYDIFPFREGQECEIYKADLYRMNDVIYIPDLTVHIGMLGYGPIPESDLEDVLDLCYTGQDILDECGGDPELAYRVFCYCDWQTPSSAAEELSMDDEDELDTDNIVVERCSNCESENEMVWDVETRGFSAFCPVCGNPLMLCDACQHTEKIRSCDYNSETGMCYRKGGKD